MDGNRENCPQTKKKKRKKDHCSDPRKYRLIRTTMWKRLMAILAKKIWIVLSHNGILPSEQKRLHRKYERDTRPSQAEQDDYRRYKKKNIEMV